MTHRLSLDDVMNAYDTCGNLAKEGAIKVTLKTSDKPEWLTPGTHTPAQPIASARSSCDRR